MKFTSTLAASLALAGTGLAAPSTCSSPRLGRRDAATINLALTDVLEKISLFDAAMLQYQGGADLTAIAETGYNMVEAVRGAGARVSNTTAVASAAEATQFAPLVERLSVAGEGLLGRVVSQTVNFTSSGICSDIYNCVNEIGAKDSNRETDCVINATPPLPGQGVGKLMTEVAAKFPAEAKYPTPATIQRFTDLFASTNARLQACAAAVPRPVGSSVSLGPWPFHSTAPPTVTGTAVLPPAGPGAATPSPQAPAPAPAATPITSVQQQQTPGATGEGAAASLAPAATGSAEAPLLAAATSEAPAGTNAAAVAGATPAAPVTGAAAAALGGGIVRSGAIAVLVAACLLL